MENVSIVVSFRKFPEGDVIALWDEEPNQNLEYISSYQIIGQHSEACPSLLEALLPATPEEYQSLLDEMNSIGYTVEVSD